MIPGHGRLCDQLDVVEYRDMVTHHSRSRSRSQGCGHDARPDQGGVAGPRLHAAIRSGLRAVDDQPVRRGDLQEPSTERSHDRDPAVVLRSRRWRRRSRARRCVSAQGRAGGAPPPARGVGADRSHRILGGRRQRRLALPHGHAAEGRLPWRADDEGSAAGSSNAWDPAADEAAGKQCKSYGAGADHARARRGCTSPGRTTTRCASTSTPARRRGSSASDKPAGGPASLAGGSTLGRVKDPPLRDGGKPTWQGDSTAQWERAGGRGGPPAGGSLTVVTTEHARRISPQERRAVQRERHRHRILRRRRRAERAVSCSWSRPSSTIPRYLVAAVHRQLAFQEGSGRFQMGSNAMFGHDGDVSPCRRSLRAVLVAGELERLRAVRARRIVGGAEHRRHLARLVSRGLSSACRSTTKGARGR